MRNENEQAQGGSASPAGASHDRRGMLRLSALGAAAVVTIRPGIAQAAVASVMTCNISIPLAADAGKWIKKDGTVVKANSANSWPPPSQPLAGEDVKNAIKYGTRIPGTSSSDQTTAYLNYINKKIVSGKPGFTCYASLQSPNRF